MFEVIRHGTNRLDITLSGKLNADEMKIAMDALVSKSENIENGRMLYCSDNRRRVIVSAAIRGGFRLVNC